MSLIINFLIYLPWILILVFSFLYYRYTKSGFLPRDIDPKGKWFLVTGAASGIGKATALNLLKLGASVYATDINEKTLESIYKSYGKQVKFFKMDVTNRKEIESVVENIKKLNTGLYGVVNSAGVAVPPGFKRVVAKGALELDIDTDVIPMYDINVFGTIRVNSAVFDLLWESKGVVANIASVAGRLAAPGMSTYAGTKHAIVGYSASMRREMARYGMRVVCIEPGFTDTPLLDTSRTQQGADMTQTRLTDLFATVGNQQALKDNIGPCQSADDVADRITTALLCSSGVAPHLLIDANRFSVWVLLSILPHAWTDKLLNLTDALTRRKHGLSSKTK